MEMILTKDYGILAKLNEGVQNIHAEIYPEFFKIHNIDEVTQFFKEVVNKPNHLFLLVKDEDEFVGYAWIEIKNSLETPFKKAFSTLYIHQINIVDDKRNKGYGSFIIHKIVSFARDHHISRIELDYWTDNSIAKNFYEKLGFKKFREHVFMEI